MDDILKLVNAKIIRTNTAGTAHLINVELLDGGTADIWFIAAVIQIETMDNGDLGDIYVENWFLQEKQNEMGEEFVTEKIL